MTLYHMLATAIAIVGAFLLRPFAFQGMEALGVKDLLFNKIFAYLDETRIKEFGDATIGTCSDLAKHMGLPDLINDYLKNHITDWNTQSSFQTVETKISDAIASFIVNIIVILVLIGILLLLLALIKKGLKLFTNLPVIKQIDKLGGLVMGLIMAALWVSIIGLVLQLLVTSGVLGQGFIDTVRNSLFVKYLYDNNFILMLLAKL